MSSRFKCLSIHYKICSAFVLLLLVAASSSAQVVKDYDPSIQRTTQLQYFKPIEPHLFSGDGMPYYHNGTFYLYWLLDEGHHAGLDGLGGHQWALSTTTDLVHWKHHPVATMKRGKNQFVPGPSLRIRDYFMHFMPPV